MVAQDRKGPLIREVGLEVEPLLRNPRILVVEDEVNELALVRKMLHLRRFECDCASSMAEAREHIRRTRYDIVLVDVHLPDGSGLELVEKTKTRDPLLIVMTGSNDIQTA